MIYQTMMEHANWSSTQRRLRLRLRRRQRRLLGCVGRQRRSAAAAATQADKGALFLLVAIFAAVFVLGTFSPIVSVAAVVVDAQIAPDSARGSDLEGDMSRGGAGGGDGAHDEHDGGVDGGESALSFPSADADVTSPLIPESESSGPSSSLAPPLTEIELALLSELSSFRVGEGEDSAEEDENGEGEGEGSSSPPTPEWPSYLLPPASLVEYSKAMLRRSDDIRSLTERGGELLSVASDLAGKREELAERTAALEMRVRRRNAEELRALWKRLNATLGEELRRRDVMEEARREAEAEAAAAAVAVAGVAVRSEGDDDSSVPHKVARNKKRVESGTKKSYVTIDELERALDMDDIINQTEAELERWVTDLAEEKVASFVRLERSNIERRRKEYEERSKCVGLIEAGEHVLSELVRHGGIGGEGGAVGSALAMTTAMVGRYDHAAIENGATISYAEGMTSDPYDPTEEASAWGRGKKRRRVRMGEVWWRRYIPEDWEGLLPTGWEHWTLPVEDWRDLVPANAWRSLRLKSSPIQPAESALTSNTNVGSCYPLPGRSGGRLTVRLPYPVEVDAVTIDHIPAVLGGEKGRSSAVRYFKVVGYPPCRGGTTMEKGSTALKKTREREECDKVGFDVGRALDLGEYEYKIVTSKLDPDGNAPGGRSVQTFDVTTALRNAAALVAEDDGEEEEEEDVVEDDGIIDEDEEEGDPGMCTIEKAQSCGGPGTAEEEKKKKRKFQAVAIIVEDNWGTDEYTCLYRFRVHGDKVGGNN